jgi:hypothetical protein
MASKCISIDLKADNIVTIAVLPGFVATDMNMHKGRPFKVAGGECYSNHPFYTSGTIAVEDSVGSMVSLIDSVNETHNGRFMTRTGEDFKW